MMLIRIPGRPRLAVVHGHIVIVVTDEAKLVSSLKGCYLNVVGILIARLPSYSVFNLVQVRLRV